MKINGTQQQILLSIPAADLKIIDETLRDILSGDSIMARQAVYNLVKDQLACKLHVDDFCEALSLNVRLLRLPGYVMVKGRYGGIRIDPKAKQKPKFNINNVTITTTKAKRTDSDQITSKDAPIGIEQPYVSPLQTANKTSVSNSRSRHVWIDRKLYRVTTTFAELETVIFMVLRGKQEAGGRITFNGKQYNCPDVDTFERYITFVLSAVSSGESDPVLNDDSGIPVELRVAS